MTKQFVGRKKEMDELNRLFNSGQSEFIAVYGRRRVGKTFLIRKAANEQFAFFMTGVHNASKSEQLTNFAVALQRYSKSESLTIPKNWILAFHQLSLFLESLPQGNKLIFIDELPWMDTAKSGFFPALENFWNSWASLRSDVKLVVCGSATSWMINNLIRNRGGLHNRLTFRLELKPFTLAECEDYFRTFGFAYSRRQIAECYMVMGGTPFYMSMMDKAKSVAQNIDWLFFSENAQLAGEFSHLYRALYKNASPHIQVVTALSGKGIGLDRKAIVQATGLADNGALSTVLEELEQCGFIRLYEPFASSSSAGLRQRPAALFQLVDFYTLFYFKFVKSNRYPDEHFWTNSLNSPMHNAWAGLSFEMLCLNHLPQIKQALGIAGVSTRACSWQGKADDAGAQIDLLIDRKDDAVNICEIKYSNVPFEIDADYSKRLLQKLEVFVRGTRTQKSLLLTLIAAAGLKHNAHSSVVQCEIGLDDLFCS